MVKKQMFTNSCGAACLLVAAGELGIAVLPDMNPTMTTGAMCMGQPLQMNDTCEAAIYQITSGSTTGVKPVAGNLSAAGYSMPHNLVLAARLLGINNVSVYMEPGVLSTVLNWFYPKARSLCESSRVTVTDAAPPALTALPPQRALRVVGVLKGVAGLHYVLSRPDGTCMDPASGADYPSFAAANDSWLKCYEDTGISIVLG